MEVLHFGVTSLLLLVVYTWKCVSLHYLFKKIIFFYVPTQAVVTSKTGTVNNVIQVKRTDFEVFDALRIDSQDSADVSGTETC